MIALGLEPASTRLPRLSPEAARERNAAYAALHGQRLPSPAEGRLCVGFGPAEELRPSLVFETRHGAIGLIAEIVQTRWAPWPAGPDLTRTLDMITLLEPLEPLVSALEQAFQTPFDPIGIAVIGAHRLQLSLLDESDRPTSRLSIASDRSLADAWRPGVRWPDHRSPVARLLPRVHVQFDGPLVPRHELGLLGVGDFVVLSGAGGGLAGALIGADGVRLAEGRFMPRPHRFEILQRPREKPAMNLSDRPPGGEGGLEAVDSADGERDLAKIGLALPIRLQVICADLRLPLARLAELGPGCVLSLEEAGTLSVELRAEDVALARGQLVALGDGYGVLIESVIA